MKSSMKIRKEAALVILQKQLNTNSKPVNRKHYDHVLLPTGIVHFGKPVQLDEKGVPIMVEDKKNGGTKPVLLNFLPLNDQDKQRINKEITNLKTKLKIA
jgi:hypothetical protein